MTFNDIFKSNFLNNVTSVSIVDMVLSMVLAFCLGLNGLDPFEVFGYNDVKVDTLEKGHEHHGRNRQRRVSRITELV